MKPVQRASEPGRNDERPIAALHVRELVEERQPSLAVRPVTGAGREDDDGPKEAPRHWYVCLGARSGIEPAVRCRAPGERRLSMQASSPATVAIRGQPSQMRRRDER